MDSPDNVRTPRLLMAAALALLAALLLLRFVNLDADFPTGITWSGVLYTDEGWYANAATRHVQTGQWYLAGDFNPAVNMPVGQLLHRAAFALSGLSLASARLTEALSFVLVIVLSGLLVRRHFGNRAGVLAALLLAANYVGFAYSRLAIMEPVGMAFVMLALWCGDHARGALAGRWMAVAGLAAAAALLTKSSMLFVLPLLALQAWQNGRGWQQRADLAIVALVLPFFLVGGYHLVAALLYPLDYTYFSLLNVGLRGVDGPVEWLFNVPPQLAGLAALGFGTLAVPAVLVATVCWLLPEFRRHRLVQLLVAYFVVCLLSLTAIRYGPPRYYLPLLVPLCALAAIAAVQLAARLRERRAGGSAWWPALPLAAPVALVLVGGVQIGHYMAQPQYSYRTMATGVADIIRSREGSLDDVVLFSDLADGVALVTGIRAVNARIALDPVEVLLARYRPRYILLHRHQAAMEEDLAPFGARLVELGAWDIYGNYHLGERLRPPRNGSASVGSADDGSHWRRIYTERKNIQLFAVDWGPASP